MEPSEPQQERSGGYIMAVWLGLLVLLGSAAKLVKDASAQLPGTETVLEGWVEIGALPFGLTPSMTAEREGGAQGLLFAVDTEAPGFEPEAEPAEKPKETSEGRGKSSEQEHFDWSAIAIGATNRPPVEFFVARYGRSGNALVETMFEPPREESSENVEVKTFDADGGTALMDRGRMRWHEYDVVYMHTRELEWGGTFVDTIAANLSLPGRPLVATARWPRGYPGSLERLGELLEQLRPVPE